MAVADDWSKSENEILADMIADGKSYGEIAVALGRTRNSVICRWRKILRSMGAQSA